MQDITIQYEFWIFIWITFSFIREDVEEIRHRQVFPSAFNISDNNSAKLSPNMTQMLKTVTLEP